MWASFRHGTLDHLPPAVAPVGVYHGYQRPCYARDAHPRLIVSKTVNVNGFARTAPITQRYKPGCSQVDPSLAWPKRFGFP